MKRTNILGYIDGVPIIEVRPRKDFPGGWEFYCDICKGIHRHGIGLGHRASHCYHRPSKTYGWLIIRSGVESYPRGYYLGIMQDGKVKSY